MTDHSSTNTASPDNERSPRHITVTASGSVSAVPDRVMISSGVQTSAKTAREAMTRNSEIMQGVIGKLKEAGLRAQDIATDNLQVHPEYARSNDHTRPPKVTGYGVTNSVRIRVTDVARLGDILDQVVELGANHISGIQFEVTEAERLRDEARTDAMANARRRAELFARAGDARLGRVLTIREGSADFAPQVMSMGMRSAKAANVPVEAGVQDLTATVTVTWELL